MDTWSSAPCSPIQGHGLEVSPQQINILPLSLHSNGHLVVLGLGLLAAPYLNSFSSDGSPWKPQSSPLFGRWILYPLVVIYILANLFVIVVCWLPSDEQVTLHTKGFVLPSFAGPLVGTVFFVAGAVYWVWDLHILPALGLRMEVLAEYQVEFTVHLTFRVSHSHNKCWNFC